MNQLLSIEPKQTLSEQKPIHTFSLKPLQFSESSFVSFQADFSPCKNNESSSVSTLPSFNSDRKHFTPAFYLSSEMNQQEHWEQSFFRTFENKKHQYTLQNKHLLQPKPDSRYCQVCLQYFQDYLKHTKHSVHINKLREGTIESQINNLVQYFKTTEKSFKRNSPVKTSEDKKSLDTYSECYQEELTLKKKLKTQIGDNNHNQHSETYSNVGSLNLLGIQQKDDQLSQF